MKTSWAAVVAAAFLWALVSIQAQPQTSEAQTAEELVVNEWLAGSFGKPLASETVPQSGTFYMLQKGGLDGHYPPYPFNPFADTDLPVYVVGTNRYLVDDRVVDYPALVSQRMLMSGLEPPGFGEGGTNSGGEGFISSFMPPTNGWLWLSIDYVSNGVAGVTLHETTNEVYKLMSKVSLLDSGWQTERSLHGTGETNLIPTTVPILNRTNTLFLWARVWTTNDVDADGLPDWWEWENFGDFTQGGTNDFDSDGVNNLDEYSNGTDPNTIQFSLTIATNCVANSFVPVQINILGGMPLNIAWSIDQTDFTNKTWQSFAINFIADVGSINGWHQIWVGLRGRLPMSQQTWKHVGVRLAVPDLTPPVLTITNPAVSTIDHSLVQLQGYASEPLTSLRYSLTNAAGWLTNQMGFVLGQYFDTNKLCFTTNYFQCFDIRLTNGVNTITLQATDSAGNTTTTNFTFTVDYSGKTNLPMVILDWPTDGTRISGEKFTWRGQTDGSVSKIIAQIINTNGLTNIINGRIGRDGGFWIEGLPLGSDDNELTLTAFDEAGNSSSTSITVSKSDVTVTLNPMAIGDSASGTIDSPDYTIWVNGLQATNYGDGTWALLNKIFTLDDSTIQVRAIPNTDNGGRGSEGIVAQSAAANPNSSQSIDLDHLTEWPYGTIYTATERYEMIRYGNDDREYTWNEGGGGGGTAHSYYSNGDLQGDNILSWPAGGRWPAFPSGTETNLISHTGGVLYAPSAPGVKDDMGSYQRDFTNSYIKISGDAQFTLIAGGTAASSVAELYEIHAVFENAMDPSGNPRSLSSNEIQQVQFGTLGHLIAGDTKFFAVIPNHTTPDITPHIPIPGSVRVGVAAFRNKLRIYNNGVDVTDRNITNMVGEKMNLVCRAENGTPITNFQWTIPGYAISNYVANTSFGKVYEDFPLTRSNAVFYWVSDGTKQVECKATVMGLEVTAKATFNVVKPTAQITTSTRSVSGDILGLRFGERIRGLEGIVFSNTVVIPSGLNSDYSTEWVNIVTSTLRRFQTNDADGQWYKFQMQDALDTLYPYSNSTTTMTNTWDSPAQDFPFGGWNLWKTMFVSDNFNMWLMFKPSGGQWVPLRKVSWNWNGEMSLSGGDWTLGDHGNSVNPADTETTTYPEWTNNITNLQFQKE